MSKAFEWHLNLDILIHSNKTWHVQITFQKYILLICKNVLSPVLQELFPTRMETYQLSRTGAIKSKPTFKQVLRKHLRGSYLGPSHFYLYLFTWTAKAGEKGVTGLIFY